jgi:predicted ATPase with chaperone activity
LYLNKKINIEIPPKLDLSVINNEIEKYDFKYINGQYQAKRALEISAA